MSAPEKEITKPAKGIIAGVPTSVPFTALFKYADRKDYVLMVLGTLGGIAMGAAWPLFAVIFSKFIQSFGRYQQGNSSARDFQDQINNLAAAFAYLALGSLIASYFEAGAWMMTGNRQASRIRGLYLRAVLRQNIAFFDTQGNSGGLLSALNADTNDIQAAMSEKLGAFLHHASTFVTGLIVAFIAGWDMTLLMLASLPLLAALGVMISRINTVVASQASSAYADASGLATQLLGQIRTVVSFGQEEHAFRDYSKALEKPFKEGVRTSVLSGLCFGLMHLVEFSTWAGALYYGAWRISTGDYNGGKVLNVMIAILTGGFALGQAFPLLQYFDAGRSAATRVYEVIDRRPAIDVDADGEVLQEVKGNIELQHVTFSYPARADVVVFREFSLNVPAGKTVALVGQSGSGKSTAIQLIQRFYDPAAGQVLLDGVDLRKLKLSWLRQQMGLVSQEPTLFATDILANIAMGVDGATKEQVIEAAKAANAHKFISALPLGYQTHVGERGLQLSGGQKQRIAIARALLKNPRIMLLDEATSALDTESERLVQDALDRLVVGRTTVVVAHRLSTIRNADLIGVVQLGQIIEMGSHQELLANDAGAYTTLVKIQMQALEQAEDKPAQVQEIAETVGVHTVASLQDLEALAEQKALAAQPESPLKPWVNPAAGNGVARPASLELVVHKVPATQLARQEAALASAASGDKVEKGEGQTAAVEDDTPAVKVTFGRLYNIVRDRWYLFITGTIGAIVAGGVTPSFALILSIIVGKFYPNLRDGNDPETQAYNRRQYNHMLDQASFYSGMLVLIGAGSVLSHLFLHASFGIVGETMARRVREMLMRSLLYMDIGFFDMPSHTSGVLANNLAEDAAYVKGAIGDTVALLSQNICTLAVGYIIAFFFDWRMTLLVTGVLPLLIASLVIYFKTISGAVGSGSEKLYADANQMVVDAFSSIRVIQSFTLQDRICELYRDLMRPGVNQVQRTSHYTGLAMGYSNATTFGIYGLIIWFGCWEVRHDLVSFDDMLKAFLCILLAAIGIGQAQIGFPDIAKASGAVARVFPLIDRPSRINAQSPDGLTINDADGDIELQNITFVYPARPSVVIFKNFSLTIRAHEQVALVGESGSGKSTVVALLQRFYDPQEGAVLLAGKDLRQYNLRWLRSQMAMVSQEPLLFACSIRDNIRYGRPEATDDELMQAAEAANAASFIRQLPDGINTTVGERGMQLSGGQKQRIAIARAVLKNARILLLDEATSALDASAELVVQEALDRIMPGRTCVTIAHRLSTIRNANTIAFVYRGQILEQGTHDELMARPDGGYARLVAAQKGNK